MRTKKIFGAVTPFQLAIIPSFVFLTANAFAQSTTQPAAQSQPAKLPELVIQAQRVEQKSPSNLTITTANADGTPTELTTTAGQSLSKTIITYQDMKDHGDHTVAEAVARTTGVSIARNGSQGQTASIFLRGANSEHTLVFLDGIEMNEAMSPSRSFDISFLSPEFVEKVEVLRGPQAILYGSGAVGGVILITSKTGDGVSTPYLAGELGSHDYLATGAGVSGGEPDANFSIHVKRETAKGISAADSELDGNSESDGFRQTHVSMRLGSSPMKNLDIAFLYYLLNADVERDTEGGKNGDDPNAKTQTKHQAMQLSSTSRFFDKMLTFKPFVSHIQQVRLDDNQRDFTHANSATENYFSENTRYGMQTVFTPRDWTWLKINLLADVRSESGRGDSSYNQTRTQFQKSTAQTEGIALQTLLTPWRGLEISLGGRADHHSSAGSVNTSAAGASYTIDPTQTRLRTSFGQGFKAPSLFQLYSSFGRADLKNEHSTALDYGADQPLFGKRALLSVTRFQNTYKDLISYDFATNKYANIGKVKSEGIEAGFSWRWGSLMKAELSYTSLTTQDESTGLALYRRPRETYSAELQAFLSSSFKIAYGFTTVGVRDDILADDSGSGTYNRVQMPTTTLQWFKTDIKFTDQSEFFLRIDNLGNIRYQPTAGFGGDRISYNSGLKVEF